MFISQEAPKEVLSLSFFLSLTYKKVMYLVQKRSRMDLVAAKPACPYKTEWRLIYRARDINDTDVTVYQPDDRNSNGFQWFYTATCDAILINRESLSVRTVAEGSTTVGKIGICPVDNVVHFAKIKICPVDYIILLARLELGDKRTLFWLFRHVYRGFTVGNGVFLATR